MLLRVEMKVSTREYDDIDGVEKDVEGDIDTLLREVGFRVETITVEKAE